jgi:hypothetical protein
MRIYKTSKPDTFTAPASRWTARLDYLHLQARNHCLVFPQRSESKLTDRSGLPSTIVARWIALVQLKSKILVPTWNRNRVDRCKIFSRKDLSPAHKNETPNGRRPPNCPRRISVV